MQCENCKVNIKQDDLCKECEENMRICACCGYAMDEGYIYEGDVYCSGECLPIVLSQFKEEYTEDGDNCWTQWESKFMD